MGLNSITLPVSIPSSSSGYVRELRGNTLIASLPGGYHGQRVEVLSKNGIIPATVSGFTHSGFTLLLEAPPHGVSLGARVRTVDSCSKVSPLKIPYGSILNPNLKVLFETHSKQYLYLRHSPLEHSRYRKDIQDRKPIRQQFLTGIRSIDTFTRIGIGQRMLLVAEPGVGKSTLLLSLTESMKVDVNIICLLGERGREISEFHESLQSNKAGNQTIVIAASSEQSPILKVQALETALQIAEQEAHSGKKVFLAIDSLTRYARALRDVALLSGEMPTRKGYPSSVMEQLPKIFERIGNFSKGSITAIFTLLASNDFLQDPLIEESISLSDGHIYLSKQLTNRAIYPAIDITQSISRLQNIFCTENESRIIQSILKKYTECVEAEELLMVSGQDSLLAESKNIRKQIEAFLTKKTGYTREELAEEILRLNQAISPGLNG